MYYFAYGSNMSEEQMAERCPSAKKVGIAHVGGYKFITTGKSPVNWRGGVASIIPEDESEVWGVVYRLKASDLNGLDAFEGSKYHRLKLKCNLSSKESLAAVTFVQTLNGHVPPSARYRAHILSAAKSAGLPQAYIRTLTNALGGE